MSNFSSSFDLFSEDEFLENKNNSIQYEATNLDNPRKTSHKFAIVSRKLFSQPSQEGFNSCNKPNKLFQIKRPKFKGKVSLLDEELVPDILFPDLPMENFSQLYKATLKKPCCRTPKVSAMSIENLPAKKLHSCLNENAKSLINTLYVPEKKMEHASLCTTPQQLTNHDVQELNLEEKCLKELLLTWCCGNNFQYELEQQCLKQNVEVKVCFSMLNSECLLIKLQSPHQLIISPSFINLPATDEHEITSLSDLQSNKLTSGRLLRLRALVIGVSSLISYTVSAKYKCSNCHNGDFTVLTSKLDTVESDLIKSNLNCEVCGLLMEEDFSQRTSAEKLYCVGVPKSSTKCLQSISFVQRSQAIKIVLRDFLSTKVNIGECYWFIGLFKYDLRGGFMQNQSVQTTFEVVAIEEDAPIVFGVKFQKVLLDEICLLYQDRKFSPWSFVLSLAFCFAEQVVPSGMYHLLKLCLILSLVMEGDSSCLNLDEASVSKHNCLHVLCEDQDLLMSQRLMMYGCSYSENPIIHRVPMDLFGSVTDEGSFFYIDGGSLVLASTHICFILNLSALKKKEQEKLSKVLECRSIGIVIPRKQQYDGQQYQFLLPINCTVWSCTERDLDCSHNAPTVPFSSQFNLVLNQAKNSGSFNTKGLTAAHVLSSASKKTSPSMFSSNQLKEFISWCRHQAIQMEYKSFKLLKAFYHTRRRSGLSNVTQLMFNTMLSLSAAHAKLMLHPKVEINDAVAAISIVEQLDSLAHGESLTGIIPVVHFSNEEMFHRIGPENDALMYQFKNHVIQLCSMHYPELRKELSERQI